MTYPPGYFPGSEIERQYLADQANARDAKAEAERVAALPPPEEAPPATPGLSAAEHAELIALRAENAARAGNTPYSAGQ